MPQHQGVASTLLRVPPVLLLLLLVVLLHAPISSSSSALHALPKQSSRRRPAHAVNLTVIALRPYNISTLNDKDSADAAGDIFFYVGDTLPQKYACR